MTTITRERLEQIYAECEERDPAIFEIRELVRIALVSLDAEPVCWTDEQELRDAEKDGSGYLFTVNPVTPHADPRRVILLYTVPPATGTTCSVFEDFWSACKHPFAQDDELKDFSWGIWKACRAAMLQSKYRDLSQPVDPQISEYEKIMLQAGNSPVTPDGWISCSERMPAQDDWVLIYSKHGEYLAGQVQGEYVELNDGTLSWLGSALHWMLLPEPPQEVK
ncbi:DUF551 domain-containing protein [Salmonella enterica]|nr:DUF551 domain-containing protein [Salmonella enterica]